jgi:hypothetical protein
LELREFLLKAKSNIIPEHHRIGDVDFLDVRIGIIGCLFDRRPVAGDAAHVVPGRHPLALSCLLHLVGVVVKVVLGKPKDGYPVDFLTR